MSEGATVGVGLSGWVLALLGLACCPVVAHPADEAGQPSEHAPHQDGSGAGSSPTLSPSSEASLPPLSVAQPFVPLAVPGHRSAVVSVPRGARSSRPVIVVAHGAGGSPMWHCELWRRIVGDRAFLLCVTGTAMYPHEPAAYAGYYYTGHPALGREMNAAFSALRERFGSHVDAAEPVFAGYSQGAIMGALLLPDHPIRFARAALIEGGFGHYQEWNVAVARRFVDHGGRRVLLACGRSRCTEQADKTARHMRAGGLEARVVYAQGAGHSCGSRMENELRDAFGWLVAGDGRF